MVGDELAAPAARFCAELERVRATAAIADSLDEVRALLSAEVAAAGGAPIVCFARSEFEAFGMSGAGSPLDAAVAWGDPAARSADRFRRVALAAALGITTVHRAIAATGTLLLGASAGCPRSVSLLPRRHVALLRSSQIVSGLGPALAGLGRELPSALHFISGPSRTSDIENDLSIGVHGPAEVHVVLLREGCA